MKNGVSSGFGGGPVHALGAVNELKFLALFLRLLAQLLGFLLQLMLEEITLACDADVLTGCHGEGTREESRHSCEEHNAVVRPSPCKAHDESGVGDEAIADTKDRCPDGSGCVNAMPCLTELPITARTDDAPLDFARGRSALAQTPEGLRMLALIDRHLRGSLRLVVVHSRVRALRLFQSGKDIVHARGTSATDERGIFGV